MPISPQYPGGLDDAITLPQPVAADHFDDPGLEHPLHHAALALIVRALEVQAGVPGSTDPASLDRLLKVIHDHDGNNSAQVDYASLLSLPTTFTPATHTDSKHSDSPNVKAALVTQIGQLLVGSAVGVLQALNSGTTGQVLTADSAQALKMKWAAPATTSAPPFAFADFLIYNDAGTWKARDQRTGSGTPFASNTDFATVFNLCSAALVAGGGTQTLNDGGSIFIARPTTADSYTVRGGIKVTTSLLVHSGMTVFAAGHGTRLIANGTSMKNIPVIQAYNANRYMVDNFAIDCASIDGCSGIIGAPTDSAVDPDTGGPNAYSIISRLDITGYKPDPTYAFAANYTSTDPRRGGEGIGIGKWGDTGATANTWVTQNHVYGGGAGSINCGLHVGDAQIFWNNFHHISTTGFGIFCDAGGLHVKFNHAAQSGAGSPNGCIYVNSGPNAKIMGNYLDNIADGAGVLIKPASGASVGAPQVIGNWGNGVMTNDAVVSFVTVDTSAGGATSNGVILDNVAEGAGPTNRFKAIFERAGGSDVLYYKVDNNKVKYCRFIYFGKKPFDLGRNGIQTGSNNDTNLFLEDQVATTLEDLVTITNTAAETDLIARVIPQDTMDVGTTYDFELYGTTDNIATSGAFKWRVRLGPVIVAEVSFPSQGSSQSGAEWSVHGMLTCRTKGASGFVTAALEVRSDFAADTKMNSGLQAIDLTANRTLSIAVDMDTANAGNTIRARVGRINLVNVAN